MPPPDPTPNFKPRARPAHTKRHRPAGSLHDSSSSQSGSDSDDSDERARRRQQKVQVITTYGDDSGSEDAKRRDRPSKHRRDDDKSTRRGGHDRKSQDRSPNREDAKEPENPPPVKWGLTINMKGAGGGKSSSKPSTSRSSPSRNDASSTTKRPLTLDDEALESLIGDPSSKPTKRPKTNTSAEDGPDAEDYRALPIDDFGAHLLRGFGWDGQLKGKVKEIDRRRANLTGLGAKGDVKGAEDLGAWNQKSSAGNGKPVRLEDYRREENKKKERRDARERESYKRERERERERDRDRR
ncbi:hypothetical protein QBC39DRAFT_349296 [Podospora conica]|nr:hypothetical protein QBC39DRAFT_349296 [Schizothecium conicum]